MFDILKYFFLFREVSYYRPEGAMNFSTDYSSTFFFVYGGSRNSKPGHWILADRLFEVETKQVPIQNETRNNSASEVVGFKMYNLSQS